MGPTSVKEWLSIEWKELQLYGSGPPSPLIQIRMRLHNILLLNLCCYQNTSGCFTGLGLVFSPKSLLMSACDLTMKPVRPSYMSCSVSWGSMFPLTPRGNKARKHYETCSAVSMCRFLSLGLVSQGHCIKVKIDSIKTAQWKTNPRSQNLHLPESCYYRIWKIHQKLHNWGEIWCVFKVKQSLQKTSR